MAAVMIGGDPHKGSHTAVAVGAAEEVLGQLRVRAGAAQARQLLASAALGGQTAALRVPHRPCIPLEPVPVSPADIGN